MQSDVDRLIERVEPWSYAFIYKGVPYRTRRPTLGMMAELQRALDTVSMTALLQFMFGMFLDGERPPVDEWPIEAIIAAAKEWGHEAAKLIRKTHAPRSPRAETRELVTADDR